MKPCAVPSNIHPRSAHKYQANSSLQTFFSCAFHVWTGCIHAGRRDGWSSISISLCCDLQAFTCREYTVNISHGVRTLWDANKYRSGAGRSRVFDTCTCSPRARTQRTCRAIQEDLNSGACSAHLAHLPNFQRVDLNHRLTERSACKAPPSQTWTTVWDVSLVQQPANRLPAAVWCFSRGREPEKWLFPNTGSKAA